MPLEIEGEGEARSMLSISCCAPLSVLRSTIGVEGGSERSGMVGGRGSSKSLEPVLLGASEAEAEDSERAPSRPSSSSSPDESRAKRLPRLRFPVSEPRKSRLVPLRNAPGAARWPAKLSSTSWLWLRLSFWLMLVMLSFASRFKLELALLIMLMLLSAPSSYSRLPKRTDEEGVCVLLRLIELLEGVASPKLVRRCSCIAPELDAALENVGDLRVPRRRIDPGGRGVASCSAGACGV